MIRECHPSSHDLYNYFSKNPTTVLTDEEIRIISEHVEYCSECKFAEETVQESDEAWDFVLTNPYTTTKEEELWIGRMKAWARSSLTSRNSSLDDKRRLYNPQTTVFSTIQKRSNLIKVFYQKINNWLLVDLASLFIGKLTRHVSLQVSTILLFALIGLVVVFSYSNKNTQQRTKNLLPPTPLPQSNDLFNLPVQASPNIQSSNDKERSDPKTINTSPPKPNVTLNAIDIDKTTGVPKNIIAQNTPPNRTLPVYRSSSSYQMDQKDVKVTGLFLKVLDDNQSVISFLKSVKQKSSIGSFPIVNTINFKITEQSLEDLETESIPNDILEKLKSLKNVEIREQSFLQDLEKTIGTEQTAKFKSLILKHAVTDISVVVFVDDTNEKPQLKYQTFYKGQQVIDERPLEIISINTNSAIALLRSDGTDGVTELKYQAFYKGRPIIDEQSLGIINDNFDDTAVLFRKDIIMKLKPFLKDQK